MYIYRCSDKFNFLLFFKICNVIYYIVLCECPCNISGAVNCNL